jgi:hypothetical protein
MATNSAKSSMSIFSSWLAAPNSGVITYIGTSTCGTMAASPWPMPEVSTTTRSKPATLQAAITSGSAADLAAEVARGQRAHEDALAPLLPRADGVHADAVAQQRAAALAREGSMRDHRDAQRVVLVQAQAADQLVGEADDLPAPPVPVMPSTGVRLGLRRLAHGGDQRGVRIAAVLQRGDQLGQRAPGGLAATLDGGQRGGRVLGQVAVAAHHHLADHAGQAHALAVLGAEDAHAVGGQVADLGRHDHAAAAAEDLDVRAAAAGAAARPCT